MFEFFSEYYALQEISQNSSALLKDKVARRELNDRIEAIYELINTKFSDVIQNTEWFTNDQKAKTVVSLSKLASDTADKFILKHQSSKMNLLIETVPPEVPMQRSRHFYAMVDNEVSKNLGFQKFPAERGLYESILKKNNLHRFQKVYTNFKIPIT